VFAYKDVTTVEENSSYYLFVTKRYDTAGTFVYSEQSQVHKTTGAVVSSFSEEMVYDKEGVLLAIKKTEPRTSDISVTVTYYDAAGKAGSAEIHLYGKTDGILLATYKITYHENGKLHEEICYKADGSFEFYRKYSENHKLLVTVTPNGSYGENNLTGYHYIGISDDGLTEMNVYFDPELNLSSGMIWEYYSPEGKTKTFTVYSDGKILKLEEYSEEGKLTKTEEYKEGVLEKVKKYEYISEEEGKVKTYDAAGNLISEEAFNPLDF
ncbi:MAG: hypothetical protein IJW21_05785, partial [Clostridia bacterium]|nr:hypothetical protein [Clostridia bacterium]